MLQVFSYWILPVISASIWLTLLTSLLLAWSIFPPRDPNDPAIFAKPPYPSMAPRFQRTPYISDIAATREIKPIFIVGCVLTTLLIDFSFIAERGLRSRGRLVKHTDTLEKVLAWCCISSAIIGTVGLVLLGIFDVWKHRLIHNTMLGFFIGGYFFAALFSCWEHYRMNKNYRGMHPELLVSSQIKLLFLVLETCLGIVFMYVLIAKNWDACAAAEWTVAYVFSIYILSYFFDFLPALNSKRMDCRFGSFVEGCEEINGQGGGLPVVEVRGVVIGTNIPCAEMR